MGRPDVTQPVDGPDFAQFTRFMREHDNVWSKVSGAERLSVSGPPDYADVVPFARHIVETFPDRVIWGTDWPHPNVPNDMPDDGELVDLFARIVDDPALRQKILVDNPTRLYWGRA
jgi:2-pyrone-4,6-dicarboxylate lactonase